MEAPEPPQAFEKKSAVTFHRSYNSLREPTWECRGHEMHRGGAVGD